MRPTFEQAKARYVHRYTMEHVPNWTRKPAPNGKFYAPQYASDLEWYEASIFPGEPGHVSRKYCDSSRQTWPLGQWLQQPYSKG